jgi:hypothetical protein
MAARRHGVSSGTSFPALQGKRRYPGATVAQCGARAREKRARDGAEELDPRCSVL